MFAYLNLAKTVFLSKCQVDHRIDTNPLLVNVIFCSFYRKLLEFKKNYFKSFLAPFSCEYEGKRYRSLDKFTSGTNGCAQCICLDGRVDCDESECKILVDPPETSTLPVPIEPRFIPNHPPPPPRAPAPAYVPTTTTTTARAPAARTDIRGNEKGPDLGYYASHLTDVNRNRDKGPTDAVPYMPEQYQYLQAQVGSPGLRGPPGMLC